MSDLIDRQAAIDALDVLCQEHRYKIPGKSETYSEYNEAWQDALDRAEGLIFNLPSAQRWIPVSERLPARNGRYLVTRGNDAGTFWNRVYIVNYSDLMGLNKEKHWWTGDVGKSNFERILDVLAWMPLPESWKGE